MKTIAFVLLACLLGSPLLALAQAPTFKVDPVVVSAAKIEQPLSRVIPSLTVIGRDEIERLQAPTLLELLQGIPGIELSRNGGPGTVSSLFLRGQNSVSTAVYVDGVRMQTDQIGGIRLNNIPPDMIDRIEVLRGNVAALYGESAIGGVVHIYTREPTDRPQINAGLRLGSRGTSDMHIGYRARKDDVAWTLAAGRFKTDGFSAQDPQQVRVNPDKDGFSRKSLHLKADRFISSAVEAGISLTAIESDLSFDSPFNAALTDLNTSDARNTDLSFFIQAKLSPDWQSRFTLAWSEEVYTESLNGQRLATFLGGRLEGQQTSLGWDHVYGQSPHGKVVFGLSLAHNVFDAYGAKHERKSSGQYVGFTGAVDRVDYQINLRADQINGQSRLQRVNKDQSSWLLGVGYALPANWRTTASVSTGFRAPATGELFGYGGTDSLRPETHRSYEIGVSWSSQDSLVRLVGFDTRTTDAIVYNSNNFSTPDTFCSTACYQNIARVENQGAELSYRGMLNAFTVKASYVMQRPRNTSGVQFPGQQSTRLARRADQYGTLELSRRINETELGGRLLYSGKRIDGRQTLKAYTLVDLYATVFTLPDWQFGLRLENIFDARYQLAYGYNTPGRGVFLSAAYRH